jgi:ABC-type glutathione transport system ATPase component
MLEFNHVGKYYRTRWRRPPVDVLRNVCLHVFEGETLGISGPSGSGKTTLVRMIPGFIRPSTGSVRFRGQDIVRLRGKQLAAYRRKVQIVFQNPVLALDPMQPIFDAVAEPVRVNGMAQSKSAVWETVAALFDDCGLSVDIGKRLPKEISGGQAQRVALARALSLNPELIIGDEMTSMLDVSVQAQMIHLVKRIQRERGLTLILISHDIELLQSVCDRVAVLRNSGLERFI